MIKLDQQKIHDYVQGKLSQTEMDAIELEYQNNPEYRQQLDAAWKQEEADSETGAGPAQEQITRMWKNIQQHIQQTKTTKPTKEPGILLTLQHAQATLEQGIAKRAAAGEAQTSKLPPKLIFHEHHFPNGEEIALRFEPDSVKGGYIIRLEGSVHQIKRLVDIKITYQDQTTSFCPGKELASKGYRITEEQANGIAKIELQCNWEMAKK